MLERRHEEQNTEMVEMHKERWELPTLRSSIFPVNGVENGLWKVEPEMMKDDAKISWGKRSEPSDPSPMMKMFPAT